MLPPLELTIGLHVVDDLERNSIALCITVEEADETEYWLEIILEAKLSNKPNEVKRLLNEMNEITKTLTTAKDSYNKKR